MSGHTPGPWFADVETTHRNHKGGFSVETNAGAVICGRMGWPSHVDESHANARLIAAAPELLDALKVMDCPVCDCSLGHSMRVTDRCSFCAKARAAITKAEGVEVTR